MRDIMDDEHYMDLAEAVGLKLFFGAFICPVIIYFSMLANGAIASRIEFFAVMVLAFCLYPWIVIFFPMPHAWNPIKNLRILLHFLGLGNTLFLLLAMILFIPLMRWGLVCYQEYECAKCNTLIYEGKYCSKHKYPYTTSSQKTTSATKNNSSSKYNYSSGSSYSSKSSYTKEYYFDPIDYDDPEEYADDAWGVDFDDWDDAYEYWEDNY